MRIAIDIDSTLHDYWSVFSRLARERYGVTLPYERQLTYDVSPAQLGPDQIEELTLESHAPHNVLGATPYEGAVEVVRGWHRRGHYIHVTSHRTVESYDATATWLERIGLPFDDLHCSQDKIPRCVELEIDLLIDDSPHNIVRAQEHGITVATLLHPWNRALCAERDVIAADNWRELAERLAPLVGTAGASAR